MTSTIILKSQMIASLYENYSIDEIVTFTNIDRDVIIKCLIDENKLSVEDKRYEEYLIAKELYCEGGTLEDVSTTLEYLSKMELRKMLIDDGVYRKRRYTRASDEEQDRTRDIAKVIVMMKNNDPLIQISRELKVDYHRLHHMIYKNNNVQESF